MLTLCVAILAQPPGATPLSGRPESFLLKGPGLQARENGLEAARHGRFADAVPLLERAVRAPPVATARERQSAATAENALGGALKLLGRVSEAAAAFARALALLDGANAPLDEATVESNLGAVLADTARPEEAEARYHSALRTLDEADGAAADSGDVLGGGGGDDDGGGGSAADNGLTDELAVARARARADVLNNLADLRHSARRLVEAHELHAQALALRERALGARHGDLAGSLNNVAVLLMDLRRHEEALPLLMRAASISKRAAGAKHPQHATALNNLGGALTQLGRPADALPHLKKALAINKAALGAAHETTQGAAESIKACEAAIEQRQLREAATRTHAVPDSSEAPPPPPPPRKTKKKRRLTEAEV